MSFDQYMYVKEFLTYFLMVSICWLVADDVLLILLGYGCSVNEILLKRGKLR